MQSGSRAFIVRRLIQAIPTLLGIFTLTFAAKDYPVVQAGVIISSVLLVISYILRDITYAFIDPRIAHR